MLFVKKLTEKERKRFCDEEKGKKYKVFLIPESGVYGGLDDLASSFDSLDAAVAYVKQELEEKVSDDVAYILKEKAQKAPDDIAYIVDRDTWEVVWETMHSEEEIEVKAYSDKLLEKIGDVTISGRRIGGIIAGIEDEKTEDLRHLIWAIDAIRENLNQRYFKESGANA